ncbi:acyl carrier protein [Paenibacillus sp. M1]|uniref:Acyl carrier protein n=1 Tax=Paenibacillus haidiansis TaxID=1574488 RepID=A0ABU7VQ95_9BACL
MNRTKVEEEIFQKVKKIILARVENQEEFQHFGMDDDFSKLGLSSLSYIKIVVDIENEYGFEFEDEDLDAKRFPDIYSLILYIHTRMNR